MGSGIGHQEHRWVPVGRSAGPIAVGAVRRVCVELIDWVTPTLGPGGLLPLAAVLFAVAGCAVDGTGALAARVTHAHEAVVVDIYTLGAQLRTRSDDRGLSIGVARRSYVFPSDDSEGPSRGWHLFHVPLPEEESVAQHHTTLGLDLRGGPVDVGATLGLRSTTILLRQKLDRPTIVAIDYEVGAPERTRLQRCLGELACAKYLSLH